MESIEKAINTAREQATAFIESPQVKPVLEQADKLVFAPLIKFLEQFFGDKLVERSWAFFEKYQGAIWQAFFMLFMLIIRTRVTRRAMDNANDRDAARAEAGRRLAAEQASSAAASPAGGKEPKASGSPASGGGAKKRSGKK
ncbi:hypothetical protein T439DRAFT_327290 [Meredithblackwellia eburnea MCA 4105]